MLKLYFSNIKRYIKRSIHRPIRANNNYKLTHTKAMNKKDLELLLLYKEAVYGTEDVPVEVCLAHFNRAKHSVMNILREIYTLIANSHGYVVSKRDILIAFGFILNTIEIYSKAKLAGRPNVHRVANMILKDINKGNDDFIKLLERELYVENK